MSRIKSKLSFVVFSAMTMSHLLSALPACSFGHCTNYNALTKQMCAQKYQLPVGRLTPSHTIAVYENGAECTCTCSCVVSETLIKMSEGDDVLARTIRKGDGILTPQAERKDTVVYGAGGGNIEKGELREVLFDNNKLLRVSLNHTFVNAKGKIVKADQVRPHDQILDLNGNPTSVIQSRRIKNYSGGLFNFITNETSKKPADHVIVTNEMQSGDWLLQTTNDTLAEEMNLRTGRVDTLQEMLEKR